MKKRKPGTLTSLQFFSQLRWLDAAARHDRAVSARDVHEGARHVRRGRGAGYNLVLAGRGKKNWKCGDLVLAAFDCVVGGARSRADALHPGV